MFETIAGPYFEHFSAGVGLWTCVRLPKYNPLQATVGHDLMDLDGLHWNYVFQPGEWRKLLVIQKRWLLFCFFRDWKTVIGVVQTETVLPIGHWTDGTDPLKSQHQWLSRLAYFVAFTDICAISGPPSVVANVFTKGPPRAARSQVRSVAMHSVRANRWD